MFDGRVSLRAIRMPTPSTSNSTGTDNYFGNINFAFIMYVYFLKRTRTTVNLYLVYGNKRVTKEEITHKNKGSKLVDSVHKPKRAISES